MPKISDREKRHQLLIGRILAFMEFFRWRNLKRLFRR